LAKGKGLYGNKEFFYTVLVFNGKHEGRGSNHAGMKKE
jgi:hypothetical protein